MSSPGEISREAVDRLYRRLFEEGLKAGYHLNPDRAFTGELLEGLLINENRYGYQTCPCRLASGILAEDMDIICPCDYRDIDLAAYDACYCALYVSLKILNGEKQVKAIPERRAPEGVRKVKKEIGEPAAAPSGLDLPVWRCRVCGYLCAREEPPELCPICKAMKERFERFM